MGAFEDVHRHRITGSLAMFDRMIFKGHLSRLYKQDGARCFLWSQGVALKDFTAYAKATTERIANNARKLVTDAGRPVISFDHVKTRNRTQHKDELAKSIAERDGITEGIICLISAVETCFSFQVRKRYESGKLELFRRERKCLHHYLYLIDDEFGFMHVRIQGWIPYECQIYLNGREWLARQLDKAGIGYVRDDNSLLAVDDLDAAAELCDRFAHKAWPRVLNAFARLLNPILPAIRAANYGGYYWVLDQAEIATDVMFQTRPQLLEVWPDLVRHAALNMSSEDVLGFLGRKLHPSLQAQVVTDTKRRPEGWRIRHRMTGNWGEGLRQGLRPAGGDHDQQSAPVPDPTLGHQRRPPARAAVVPDAKGCERPVAQLPSGDRGQPPLPRRPRRRPTQKARASPRSTPCAGRQPTASGDTPASARSARPTSPCSEPRWPASTPSKASPQHGPHQTSLPTPTRRPRRSPPTMRTRLTAHRQTPRPRPRRQDPTRPSLPSHPLRPTRHDRRHLPPRRPLRRQLSRRLTESRTCLRVRANPAEIGSNAGSWIVADRHFGDRCQEPALGVPSAAMLVQMSTDHPASRSV